MLECPKWHKLPRVPLTITSKLIIVQWHKIHPILAAQMLSGTLNLTDLKPIMTNTSIRTLQMTLETHKTEAWTSALWGAWARQHNNTHSKSWWTLVRSRRPFNLQCASPITKWKWIEMILAILDKILLITTAAELNSSNRTICMTIVQLTLRANMTWLASTWVSSRTKSKSWRTCKKKTQLKPTMPYSTLLWSDTGRSWTNKCNLSQRRCW